jgi:dTDP-4-dehydrorhamnose 3,5-epimerase-like enzyme
MAQIINLNTFSDYRGNLTVIEKILTFEIKRVFYIYNIPSKNITRGGHRHRRITEALICLKGRCEIANNDGNKKENFVLDSPEKCLILQPKDWRIIHDFSKEAILLVLASEYYNPNDYIEEEY